MDLFLQIQALLRAHLFSKEKCVFFLIFYIKSICKTSLRSVTFQDWNIHRSIPLLDLDTPDYINVLELNHFKAF